MKRGDAADAETYQRYVEAEPRATAKNRVSQPKWNFEMGSSQSGLQRVNGGGSMKGVYVMKIGGVNPDDQRGRIWEWRQDGKQVTIIERKKGAIFGQHYHKGEDVSKDPERFFLAHGRMRILFERRGEEGEEYFLDAGTVISIDPYIYHELEALEDCVLVEYRETIFDPAHPDTYRRE